MTTKSFLLSLLLAAIVLAQAPQLEPTRPMPKVGEVIALGGYGSWPCSPSPLETVRLWALYQKGTNDDLPPSVEDAAWSQFERELVATSSVMVASRTVHVKVLDIAKVASKVQPLDRSPAAVSCWVNNEALRTQPGAVSHLRK
jgi:hypothetical protein